jgi:radical SAM superfamily enzyme YgiQ (UPF0313 family)
MKEKRKLLLVSANQFATPYPVYPIGLSYLFSYLVTRLPDFDIRIFDFNLHSREEFRTYLKDFNPDYTGLSFRNVDDVDSYHRQFFVSGYKEIIDIVKQTIKTRIIIGGSAFSIFPQHLYDFFQPEFGIYGEGEESMFRLITTLEKKEDFTGIPGLVYRTNGSLHLNDRKKFIKDPALHFDESLISFYWKESGMMNIQTKRGCPHRCIYCTYPLIEGRRVRTLDIENIIETMVVLTREKNINYVFFTDSVFNINRSYNIRLAERMIKANTGIKWGAYFSPHDLSIEELELYQRAGLTHIEFGTESLSDSTLKNYGKHFNVDDVVEVSDNCNKAGIYFSHFLILGGYGETEETINESFENSKRFNDTVFFPFVGMRIYPKTPLHKIAVKEGIVLPDDDLLDPAYYIAEGIDYSTLKERADQTGKRWVFPDEDVATAMNRLRKRNRKGMLWHHLRK